MVGHYRELLLKCLYHRVLHLFVQGNSSWSEKKRALRNTFLLVKAFFLYPWLQSKHLAMSQKIDSIKLARHPRSSDCPWWYSEHLTMSHEIDIDSGYNREAALSELYKFLTEIHRVLWCQRKYCIKYRHGCQLITSEACSAERTLAIVHTHSLQNYREHCCLEASESEQSRVLALLNRPLISLLNVVSYQDSRSPTILAWQSLPEGAAHKLTSTSVMIWITVRLSAITEISTKYNLSFLCSCFNTK
jgi:hypothetical protein